MCASTVQPAWLGRAQGTRQPEARDQGGQEEDAAFPRPLSHVLLIPHPPFPKRELYCEKICQGLTMCHAERVCCILVPSLRN